MRIGSMITACAAAVSFAASANAQDTLLSNDRFQITMSQASGGITSLKLPNDVYDTQYINPGRWIGDVVLRYRTQGGEWTEGNTASSGDIRVFTQVSKTLVRVSYSGDSNEPKGIRSVSLEENYHLNGGALTWTLKFKNKTTEPIEIGDIAIPMNFNTRYREYDAATIFNKCVMRHSLVAGDGSFMFLSRCSGTGPYLVMTPGAGTHLEYFGQRGEPYSVYIHAKARTESIDTGGTWRLPITSITLKPGQEISHSFKFQWADDYAGVRKTLVREGLISVEAVPGMVIPQKMPAMLALTTDQPINSITPEFPNATKIEYVGKKQGNIHLYKVSFSRIGENMLTVNYGKGRKLYLEYFCTQPLETVIAKRASFIVEKQQVRDESKWYDGLFSIWDMPNKILRNPDDTGGLRAYMVGGSDDPTNCKAPYVALKNVTFPVQSEIDALEYYAERFLWGGMQRTDTETPYPYGIYGIDNWYLNRNSDQGFGSGTGKDHLWRSFDYPAIFYFYLNMYKIAKLYPGSTKYLDADGYLERAYRTARAFFEVAYGVKTYHGRYTEYTYKIGIYNELCIPEIIEILRAEGRKADAEWLRGEWEKKVKFFIYDDPYPYTSEYAYDTTAYESTHALAKYALEYGLTPAENLWQDKNSGKWYSHPKVSREDAEDFMERQTAANIACRGWLETSYYHLGSDIRAGGNASYQLSYMAQMAGWSIIDYALNYSKTPEEHMRLGYASALSSWALVNCGDKESNYGYWYPGPDNDGAAGWAFEPQKMATAWNGVPQGRGPWTYDGEIDHGFLGGIRCARTVVVNDPIFGLFAYGGAVSESEGVLTVVPMDGIRQKLHFINTKPSLEMELNRDNFAKVSAYTRPEGGVRKLYIILENRTKDAHRTELRIKGLPDGNYTVTTNGATGRAQVRNGNTALTLPIPAGTACEVSVAPAAR